MDSILGLFSAFPEPPGRLVKSHYSPYYAFMPTEDRRIMFENDEVYKAIYALCMQRQLKKPPPGVIKSVSEDGMDVTRILIIIENPQDKSSAVQNYTSDFLAAALMMYCKGCGIPLPKNAKKSVMIADKHVILRVQI